MPVEKLTTIYSQHTVFLQRIGATQGNAVIPFLNKIEEDTQRIFNRFRDRRKTSANQLAIQSAINESTRGHLQDYIRIDIGRNLTHGSDSPENGQAEIALWFDESELASWQKIDHDWVYE